MKLREFQLLADENIDADVIAFLTAEGFDILRSVDGVGPGASDIAILQFGFEHKRLVVTHDRDFGALVFAAKNPFFAILYLRPGHVIADFTIQSLRTVLSRDIDLKPPCIVVCERTGEQMMLRIRQPID